MNLAKQKDTNLHDAGQLHQGLTDLLSEFTDVFELPGSSHPREVKHQITLEDKNSSLPGLVYTE